MRNAIVIALCILLVLLITLGSVISVYLIHDNVSVYQLHISEGNRYADDEDYAQAIAAYRSAILKSPNTEEAYYQLALIYIKLESWAESEEIICEGLENAYSDRLQELYDRYFGNKDTSLSSEPDNSKTEMGVINSQLCGIIANYTYDDYRIEFSGFSEGSGIGLYHVNSSVFVGDLHFFNVDGESVSINSMGKPYAEVRPNYVVLSDLSYLFAGLESGGRISYTDLSDYDAYDIITDHDSRGKYVKFSYEHCVVEIVLDDGFFDKDSENILYSEYGVGSASENIKHKGSVKIINATTADAVPAADVLITDDKDNRITEHVTDSTGYCHMELTQGSYVMTVSAEGYIEESFEFRVYSSGIYSIDRVSISPELGDGEIRVVLEWGRTPLDLDSYYMDENGKIRVKYNNRQYYDDGELIAELDVDDSDGYGPETLTVYDTERDFTYAVADFTGSHTLFSRTDVTVKVYLPGETAPIIFTPPGDSSISENAWIVFEYVDGEVIYIGDPAPTQGVNGK